MKWSYGLDRKFNDRWNIKFYILIEIKYLILSILIWIYEIYM